MRNLLHPNRHLPAVLIAIAFVGLGVTYSIVTPIFEALDEVWHYPFVWHLARTWELPVQDPANVQLWRQEASQPPLYYALAALLTAPIPTADLPDLIYRNPHADLGLVTTDGNINMIVHTARENWPWQGAVLAVHVARFLSVLLGTGTVLATYGLGRILWPERPAFAWLAMAFVAFNPMFLFVSGSVNNDNLITLLASLTLWRLVALVVSLGQPQSDRGRGFKKSRLAGGFSRVWPFIILGTLVGLAMLAKLSGLGLLGLVGFTVLWLGWQQRSWRFIIIGNGLVGVLAIALAGWWYWRNFWLYGDWTGTQTMVTMMGPRPIVPTIGQLWSEIPGLMRSFWGLFGGLSLPLPSAVYWLLNLLLAAGLAGLPTTWLLRRTRILPTYLGQTWPILVGWLILLLIGLVQWTLQTPASQGRLLFPGLAALALLWAAGWMVLVPLRWSLLPGVILLVLAMWVPWRVIAPAYARPAAITILPSSAEPLQATFGQVVGLLAYESRISSVQPGDTVPLTLYWRGEKDINIDYSVFIHLVDQNNLIVAQRDVFHGLGLYPTSQWTSGRQFVDTYTIPIPQTTLAPAQVGFAVGLYDKTTGARLPVSTGGDTLYFGSVAIQPRSGRFPNEQELLFEEGIALVGYTVDQQLVSRGDGLTLTLYWHSQTKPAANYKVFVHLVAEGDVRAAQHDSEPAGGTSPTSTWTPGQVVIDKHPLTISADAPPGAYRLVVGLYAGDSGRRLRLLQDRGISVQADAITLAGVRVE